MAQFFSIYLFNYEQFVQLHIECQYRSLSQLIFYNYTQHGLYKIYTRDILAFIYIATFNFYLEKS